MRIGPVLLAGLLLWAAGCGASDGGTAPPGADAAPDAPVDARVDARVDAPERGDGAADGGEPGRFDPRLPPGVTLADPVLLTFAAARPRAEYLVDEGYTLERQADGALAFATDTAGDFGVALEVDGALVVLGVDAGADPVIETTTSDALRLGAVPIEGGPGEGDPGGADPGGADLALRLSFGVTTSRVATLELAVERPEGDPRAVAVVAWLRRCEGGYEGARDLPGGGVAAQHGVPIPPELRAVGPGTYVERAADALVVGESAGAGAGDGTDGRAGAAGDAGAEIGRAHV